MGHLKGEIARTRTGIHDEIVHFRPGTSVAGLAPRDRVRVLSEMLPRKAFTGAVDMQNGDLRGIVEGAKTITPSQTEKLDTVAAAFDRLVEIGGPGLARDYLGSPARAKRTAELAVIINAKVTDPRLRVLVVDVLEERRSMESNGH